MRLVFGRKGLLIMTLVAAALVSGGCSSSENTNATANSNASNSNSTVNVNSSSNANMTTSTVTTNTGQTIEAREPDKYSATVVVTALAPVLVRLFSQGWDEQTIALARKNPFYVLGQPRRAERATVAEVLQEIEW